MTCAAETFPNVRGEFSKRAEPDALIKVHGFPVGAGYGQADPAAAVLFQSNERLAKQLVSDAGSAHLGRHADLRNVSRFRADDAGERNAG